MAKRRLDEVESLAQLEAEAANGGDVARLAIARDLGFADWESLAAHLGLIAAHRWDPPAPVADEPPADRFVRRACLDYDQWHPSGLAEAGALLAAHPALPAQSFAVAVAAGDVAAVEAHLAREPGLVRTKGGVYRWEPLLYATYSRMPSPEGGRSTLEVARVLLAAGADANAGFFWRGLVPPFTALTGAFGEGEAGNNHPPHPERLALARLLLEAGADPNDDQALYNCQFSGGEAHMRLLLEYGLGQEPGGPWHERLGPRFASPARTMAHELGKAAEAGDLATVKLLVKHAAAVDAPRPRDGRTPFELASRSGNRELVAYLVAAGATARPLAPEDRFAGACLAADRAEVEAVLAATPDVMSRLAPRARAELIAHAADAHDEPALRLMLSLGFDINGMTHSTALHNAAFRGDVAAVKLLLALGADPKIRDPSHDGTAHDWAVYNHQHVVAELLAARAG